MKTILEIIERAIKRLGLQDHGENGCVFASGAITITGDFYGFSVGDTKPDSIAVSTENATYKLDNVILSSTDNIIEYVSIGEYVPIRFTSITITGTGYLKLWRR